MGKEFGVRNSEFGIQRSEFGKQKLKSGIRSSEFGIGKAKAKKGDEGAERTMGKKELEHRTKQFALTVIRFTGSLPRNQTAEVIGRQLLQSATSVGANYREANRAESRPDFIHKVALVEKESAETCYWLELLADSETGNPDRSAELLKEANELLAIFTTIGKHTKSWVRESDAMYQEVEE